ncbi:MAG: hypothetical protein WBG04_06095 [Haloferula sp.]
MSSPTRSGSILGFLAMATMAWLALVHGIAFFFFGISLVAVWVVVGSLTVTFVGILAYLAWEFRRATPVPDDEGEVPLQDVSLLMLSRSTHGPRPFHLRRTRTRLSGKHPATDRIVVLHRPPHLDRRVRKPAETSLAGIAPLPDFPENESGINPSAN